MPKNPDEKESKLLAYMDKRNLDEKFGLEIIDNFSPLDLEYFVNYPEFRFALNSERP